MVDLARAARLRQARASAGYARPIDAADAFGWKRTTYFSHENGHRGISRDPIARYATAFRVSADWLAYGEGPMRIGPRRIRIEGLVGDLVNIEAGFHLEEQGETEIPDGIDPDEFAAFRVGDDPYPACLPGDVILVARHHGPPEELIGRRCMITLKDGRRRIGTLLHGSQVGLFVLASYAAPLLDIEILDAAPIAWIKFVGG
jgi:hypothetical protein